MAETSKLKSALGLENLKALGETVKQVSELQKSLNESKEAITKLLDTNNPISLALQRSLDAETLKGLREGDQSAFEQLKIKVDEENQKLEVKNKAMEEENRQLKDALQAKTTREIIREELDSRLPKGDNPGGDSNLNTAINNLVAERLNALVGGGQQGTLTAEDIRKVIGEEVTKATQGNNSPDQVTDNIVKMLTVSDMVKQKLGIEQGGSRYLPQAGNLRGDVLKILLEDERERLKLDHEHEIQQDRNKHLGVLVGTVKDNMEDIIGASREMVAEHRESKKEPESKNQTKEDGGYGVKCSECGEVSIFPEIPTGTIECQHCHAQLEIKPPTHVPQQPASSLEF